MRKASGHGVVSKLNMLGYRILLVQTYAKPDLCSSLAELFSVPNTTTQNMWVMLSAHVEAIVQKLTAQSARGPHTAASESRLRLGPPQLLQCCHKCHFRNCPECVVFVVVELNTGPLSARLRQSRVRHSGTCLGRVKSHETETNQHQNKTTHRIHQTTAEPNTIEEILMRHRCTVSAFNRAPN